MYSSTNKTVELAVYLVLFVGVLFLATLGLYWNPTYLVLGGWFVSLGWIGYVLLVELEKENYHDTYKEKKKE